MPAYGINGISTGLGITLVYVVAAMIGGHAAAVAASSGAVYASTADVPLPPARTWRRVLTGVLIGCLVSLLVSLLRPWPITLGCAIAAVGFLSAMTLAWGPRALQISFVGMLSFVFTMAAPPALTLADTLERVGDVTFGAILYFGWAMLAAYALKERYRTLALATVLRATGRLLQARAALLSAGSERQAAFAPLQIWIADESQLDDQLQIARDHLFAALDDPLVQRQTALLLLAIDLRDGLQLGQLDLDALGHDEHGRAARMAIAQFHHACGELLERMQYAVSHGSPWNRSDQAHAAVGAISAAARSEVDPERGRLIPLLASRAHQLVQDLDDMQNLLEGAPPQLLLARDELQLFISLDGWPIAALRPHLKLESPVFRHAIRSACALTAAYVIGIHLPWASHPHWLVLSVAVVLRGNLEQTLARRNQRISGTVLGCLIVLLISHFATRDVSTVLFLGATGVAHAFAPVRYFVTATAATMMALLQDHLSNPGRHFAFAERLADTVMGAALAWAFSFVLPAWEHGQLPRLVKRLLRALTALSNEATRLPIDSAGSTLALRLARLEAYDALRALAAAAQRSSVEPESVRPPAEAFASLVRQSHLLMAHLAAVRMLTTRRSRDLDPVVAGDLLRDTASAISRRLESVPAPDEAPHQNVERPLPPEAPTESLTPWLRRRLQLSTDTAGRIAWAAAQLTAPRAPAHSLMIRPIVSGVRNLPARPPSEQHRELPPGPQ